MTEAGDAGDIRANLSRLLKCAALLRRLSLSGYADKFSNNPWLNLGARNRQRWELSGGVV